MSNSSLGHPARSSDANTSKPVKAFGVSIASLIVVLGAILFIGTEVFAVAAAAVWASVGMLHLGHVAMLVLAAIVAVPAVIAVVKIARLAWLAETGHSVQD